MTDMPEREALNDEAEVMAVLRALMRQLAGSGYRDRLGHPVEMNVAYRDAVALLKLRGFEL